MNGYAVYKVQTRSSIKDKQVKEKVPSPVCSVMRPKYSPKNKNYQNFSLSFLIAMSMLNFTAILVHPSISAIRS